MKLAAIDIGSNAIRFQITNITQYQGETYFKRLEYVRFPLRLGQDVFKQKAIGQVLEDKFLKLMHSFKLLIELYEVDDYYACATSAMREAKNGRAIAEKVKQLFDLKINIISGEEEAELINRVVMKQLKSGTFLHIDVGGGSTEFNLIKKGERKLSKSFKIGSVRSISKKSLKKEFDTMANWLTTNIANNYQNVTAVGTGGNINKLYELSNTKSKTRTFALEKLEEVQALLKGLTTEEMIYRLHLNPDRADVILPASKIYKLAMQSVYANKIIVPDVGLKDGIMHMLYERNLGENQRMFK
ncbi:phosphatase [Roseivirga pacifica]|uniref:Ppx/GppA phosphatase family protein n=1 Tax=Roseivirga pacifica TaxID=1267423 RepID=UPI00227AA608